MIQVVIDGINFDNLEGFYSEIEVNLTKGLDFRIGRNLNAFNDILWGGFGVHEYEEPLRIIWRNIDKSRKDLKTDDLFRALIEIIREHSHIDLVQS